MANIPVAANIAVPYSVGLSPSQPAPVIYPTSNSPAPLGKILQSGVVGVAYTETITSTGGTSPYTYAITDGSLPTGTSLSSGVISGVPTGVGTFSFTVTVTDANGLVGSNIFEIIVSLFGAGSNPNYGFIA